jgi:hypothetical protein
MSGARECGGCDLCCTVLRVDELAKLGGVPCKHLREAGGCGIYAERPRICRSYRCQWLQGGFEEEDRPDRLGAVVDLINEAGVLRLAIREASPGAFDRSARLQQIAERYRSFMPVRVTTADDVMNPDAEFRVLLADGEEQRIAGDRVEVWRAGRHAETRRLPWGQRVLRRALQRWRGWRLRRLHPPRT